MPKEMRLSNPDEWADRNFPDTEELTLNRGRMMEFAKQAALDKKPDPGAVWAEGAGPGSYRWFWVTLVRRSPLWFGWTALAISLAGIFGSVFDAGFLAGEILGGSPLPLASAIMLAFLSLALILIRNDAPEPSVRAGNLIAWGF